MQSINVLGSSGFIGKHIVEACHENGRKFSAFDRCASDRLSPFSPIEQTGVDFCHDVFQIPAGPIVIAFGNSDIGHLHQWQHCRDSCVALARLAPLLAGRDVVILSTVDVYGRNGDRLDEDARIDLPIDDARLDGWAAEMLVAAPFADPTQMACALLNNMRDMDPTGRWVYAHAKRMQELMVQRILPADRLHILRMANVYGVGQFRVLQRMVANAMMGRSMIATDTSRSFISVARVVQVVQAAVDRTLPPGIYNLGGPNWPLPALAALVRDTLAYPTAITVAPRPADDIARTIDSSKIDRLLPRDNGDDEAALRDIIRSCAVHPAPVTPPIGVVVPPRPFDPAHVARRQRDCLQSGALKYGNRWTGELTALLSDRLGLDADRRLLLTNSGTSALRLSIVALAGPAAPGDIAVLPSFTFPATAEVLIQLGYKLRFCDVDADSWTIDPQSLAQALAPGDCKLVIAVDALGNPCDYAALQDVCTRYGAILVADSAATLGAEYRGKPVGTQAAAHAFSMSFAKTISAGGAGGAVIVPTSAVERLEQGANWWRSSQMPEIAAIVALDLAERLDTLIARREAVAKAYSVLDGDIAPQRPGAHARHAWVHWVARFDADRRDAIAQDLADFGIGTKPYYAPALHDMAWLGHAEPAHLPVTDQLCREVLALPMSSEIGAAQAEHIAFLVHHVLQRHKGDGVNRRAASDPS